MAGVVFTFTEWSGDASGTATQTVVNVDADREVWARFIALNNRRLPMSVT
jgi:hypothetical protein